MNLAYVLSELYPNANPHSDYLIGRNSEGDYIAEWRLEEEQPTLADLEVRWFEFLKERKIEKLNEQCDKQITDGFFSPSTGFTFEFAMHDQNNFSQQAIILLRDTAITEVSWKTLDQGVQPLTREQFFTVIKESENHKRNAISKYWTLKALVNGALTEEEINSVYWNEDEKPIEEPPEEIIITEPIP